MKKLRNLALLIFACIIFSGCSNGIPKDISYEEYVDASYRARIQVESYPAQVAAQKIVNMQYLGLTEESYSDLIDTYLSDFQSFNKILNLDSLAILYAKLFQKIDEPLLISTSIQSQLSQTNVGSVAWNRLNDNRMVENDRIFSIQKEMKIIEESWEREFDMVEDILHVYIELSAAHVPLSRQSYIKVRKTTGLRAYMWEINIDHIDKEVLFLYESDTILEYSTLYL